MKFAAAVIAIVLGLMVLNGAIELLASSSWFGPIAVMFLISTILGVCAGTAFRLLDGPR